MIYPLITSAVLSFFVLLYQIMVIEGTERTEKERQETKRWILASGLIFVFSVLMISTQI